MTIISFCTQLNINYALCSPDFTSRASMIENVCSLNETSDTASFFLVWLESEEETHVSLSIFLDQWIVIFLPTVSIPQSLWTFFKTKKNDPQLWFFPQSKYSCMGKNPEITEVLFPVFFQILSGGKEEWNLLSANFQKSRGQWNHFKACERALPSILWIKQ